MRRATAVALALAALAAVPAGSQGAVCPGPSRLMWHAKAYKPVATRATVPLGRRLGTGTLVTCRTTHAPPGYAAAVGPRARADGTTRRLSVYAVPGIRPQVALALRGRTRASLYVSRATPTASERAALARLRRG
jgi:hypothetical protein